MADERWDKLKAGLYDAIYGKGLAQPYLDATASLMDELKAEHAELLRAIHRLPKPPASIGDGPDERVGYVLDRLEIIRDEALIEAAAIAKRESRIRAKAARMGAHLHDPDGFFQGNRIAGAIVALCSPRALEVPAIEEARKPGPADDPNTEERGPAGHTLTLGTPTPAGSRLRRAVVNSTLRELRRHRGWTQEKLAMMADVSTRTVWAIEAGRTRPRMEIRQRILRELGRPLSDHRDVFGPLPKEESGSGEEV